MEIIYTCNWTENLDIYIFIRRHSFSIYYGAFATQHIHSAYKMSLNDSLQPQIWDCSKQCCSRCGDLLQFEEGKGQIFFAYSKEAETISPNGGSCSIVCDCCRRYMESKRKHCFPSIRFDAISTSDLHIMRAENDCSLMYQCGDCSAVFSSRFDVHHHAQGAKQSCAQVLLSGPNCLSVAPRVDSSVCQKATVKCRYCSQDMKLEDWPAHVQNGCTLVPCALSMHSLLDSVRLATRHRRLPSTLNLSQHFLPLKDGRKTCNCSPQRFNSMLQHLKKKTRPHVRAMKLLNSVQKELSLARGREDMGPSKGACKVARGTTGVVIVSSKRKIK